MRALPAAQVLPQELRLLLRVGQCAERCVLVHALLGLQWRDLLERMAQRSAALPGSLQLPGPVDWSELWAGSVRIVQRRVLRRELPLQLGRLHGCSRS